MKKNLIMERQSLRLWERLSLILEGKGGKTEFLARVEDVKKGSFVVGTLVRHSGDAGLAKGDIVEVKYNREDAVYFFKASIKDLFEGDTRSAELEKKGETGRLQRRQYVRLDISGEMIFRVLDSRREPDGGLSRKFTGSLLNISAGGVLFETDSPVDPDTLLILDFSLKGQHSLNNILAVVKRVESLDDRNYLVGTEFITGENRAAYGLEALADFLPPDTGTFDEGLQKLVMQFIYNQQIEFRKKEVPR